MAAPQQAIAAQSQGITHVTSLISDLDTTDGTAFVSGSFTPSPNSLIIACFNVLRSSSANPSTVTVTDSASLTWSVVVDFLYITTGTTRSRVQVYAAKAPAAPAAMTVTATYAQTVITVGRQIFEVLGSDVINTVAGCFVQTAVTSADSAGATSLSLTLSAATNAKNRAFLMCGHWANEGTTPRANWTEIGDASGTSPVNSIETQWRSDAFETTATASWATSSNFGGIAFEVKARA